nr:unnamed protein product [Spirometra erinaceieuropaei]
MGEIGTNLLRRRIAEQAREQSTIRDAALENKFRKLPNPTSPRNDKRVHNLSSKELTKDQMQVLRHEASFNTADARPVNMIAAVESILGQTEATEETKNLIRHQVSSLLMAHRPREVLSKVERDALRELKADKDLVIVPADKGRATVVLDRTDYLQKTKGLLEDRQFYVPCATNPLKALTREINATLLALENSGAITPTDRRMARQQDTALARFYGLPKVHKDGAPLRTIVSLKGTPTYGLAKWLFRRLKFLTAGSDTTVSSSAQFLEKLKGDLGIETIELLLQSKYDETENRLGHAQILQLLKLSQDVLHVRRDNLRTSEGHTNGFADFGIHRRGGPATVRVAGLPTPQTEILGPRPYNLEPGGLLPNPNSKCREKTADCLRDVPHV